LVEDFARSHQLFVPIDRRWTRDEFAGFVHGENSQPPHMAGVTGENSQPSHTASTVATPVLLCNGLHVRSVLVQNPSGGNERLPRPKHLSKLHPSGPAECVTRKNKQRAHALHAGRAAIATKRTARSICGSRGIQGIHVLCRYPYDPKDRASTPRETQDVLSRPGNDGFRDDLAWTLQS
jgi:hypothetical protein